MNKITLIGNLTRDPELSTTPSGVTLCRFTIAVNRRFAQQGGEKVTDFFRIVTWRQQAENCSRYLAKGRKVAVIGELQASTYVSKEGETRMSLDVNADEVEFLSPRQDEGDKHERFTPVDSAAPSQGSSAGGFVDVEDDTLPF